MTEREPAGDPELIRRGRGRLRLVALLFAAALAGMGMYRIITTPMETLKVVWFAVVTAAAAAMFLQQLMTLDRAKRTTGTVLLATLNLVIVGSAIGLEGGPSLPTPVVILAVALSALVLYLVWSRPVSAVVSHQERASIPNKAEQEEEDQHTYLALAIFAGVCVGGATSIVGMALGRDWRSDLFWIGGGVLGAAVYFAYRIRKSKKQPPAV